LDPTGEPYLLPDHDTMVLNVLAAYADATTAERREGFAWYPEARDYAAYLAQAFGLPTTITAAVIAALSPQTSWGHNKRWAREVVEAYALGQPLPRRGLGNNLRRAALALSGDLSDIHRTKGTLKVHNFYRSILGNPGAVCVDRHALRVVLGDPNATGYISSDGVYERAAEAYRDAAKELKKGARHVQAVTWLVMRRQRDIAGKFA
jgi:hypothetical protein